ncbi:MAG: hypothetical protein OEW24_09620, partial [Chloroflexota bacterium]|nr:hypothetical protein [Chloroflexota bacterium]
MTSVTLDSATGSRLKTAVIGLDAGVPVALFPIRLETRIVAGDPTLLRIRVYPDQIHIDQHDPMLSEFESQLGAEYWSAQAKTRTETEQMELWTSLASTLGANRAAFVASATQKAMATKEPGGPRTAGRYTARLRLLPTRWVATGFGNGEEMFAVVGKKIPRDLELRVDGEDTKSDRRSWFATFERALEVGMALEVALSGSAQGFLNGPNQLVVLG